MYKTQENRYAALGKFARANAEIMPRLIRYKKERFCSVLLKYLVIAVSNFTARQKLS